MIHSQIDNETVLTPATHPMRFRDDDSDITDFLHTASRWTVAPTSTHPLSPIMPVDEPSTIYRDQLSSKHHGLALWEPKPVRGLFEDPDHVSIGDVGYVDNGAFMRMFNVTLPSDHPSNRLQGIPEGYKPLKQDHFENIRHSDVRQEEYHSHLSKVDNVQANTHAEWVIVLSCTASIPLISSVF